MRDEAFFNKNPEVVQTEVAQPKTRPTITSVMLVSQHYLLILQLIRSCWLALFFSPHPAAAHHHSMKLLDLPTELIERIIGFFVRDTGPLYVSDYRLVCSTSQ